MSTTRPTGVAALGFYVSRRRAQRRSTSRRRRNPTRRGGRRRKPRRKHWRRTRSSARFAASCDLLRSCQSAPRRNCCRSALAHSRSKMSEQLSGAAEHRGRNHPSRRSGGLICLYLLRVTTRRRHFSARSKWAWPWAWMTPASLARTAAARSPLFLLPRASSRLQRWCWSKVTARSGGREGGVRTRKARVRRRARQS